MIVNRPSLDTESQASEDSQLNHSLIGLNLLFASNSDVNQTDGSDTNIGLFDLLLSSHTEMQFSFHIV